VALKATLNAADARAGTTIQQEREALSDVAHPNIVGIREFVEHGGIEYIVMDYVHGRSLDVLALRFTGATEGRLPPVDAVRYLIKLLEPLAYLRGILAGPNSRAESKVLAAARLKRLVRRLAAAEWHAEPKSEGEQVAMSWLCEMLTLHQAALLHPAKVLWVNFDAFLAAPQPSLQAIFHALGAQAAQQEIAALVSGPIMRQYSKAPEHAYDAQLRREVLQSADWDHAAEIRRGLAWLEGVARQYPLAAAVLRALEARRVT